MDVDNYLEIFGNNGIDELFDDFYEDDLDMKSGIMMFNKGEYLVAIRASFANANRGDEIERQFRLDCNRSKIKYNGRKVRSLDQYLWHLRKTYSQTQIDDILMVCTQASLGYPFELLHNCLNRYEFHVGENNNTETYKISFYDDGEFVSRKKLRVFDDDGNTICFVKIKVFTNLFMGDEGSIKIDFII